MNEVKKKNSTDNLAVILFKFTRLKRDHKIEECGGCGRKQNLGEAVVVVHKLAVNFSADLT